MIKANDFALTNGFIVIRSFDSSNPIICLQLNIRTGSVNETGSTSGFSHFIEHLVFKNTRKYTNNSISSMVTRAGGFINAYTEYDSTCFYLLLPSEQLELGLDVLSEMAIHVLWTDQDIATEKDVIKEEIKQYSNEPESAFIDWIQESYFIKHPLKRPVLGTIKSVQKASKEELIKFYTAQYRPDNAFLVITGSFHESNLKPLVEKYFGPWKLPRNPIIKNEHDLLENNGFRLHSRRKINSDDLLAFALPELSENHALSIPMLLLVKAFATGNRSRLFKRLVEKDKTVLNIRLYSISGVLHGITIIEVIPLSGEYIADIVYAFYDEWVKLTQSGLTSDEQSLIIKELIYSWLYDFEYIETQAGSLTAEELLGSYQKLYKFPKQISSVKSQEISSAFISFWKKAYLAIYHQGKAVISQTIKHNIQKLFENLPDPVISQFAIDYQSRLVLNNILRSSKQNNKQRHIEFCKMNLDSGMRLVMRFIDTKPTIGIALTNPVSQLSESYDKLGVNYLTSNLLLYGTRDKSYDEIQKQCLENGFNLKINHTMETTTLRGKCLEFDLNNILKLASELIQYPAFPLQYLNLIKSNVYDSIRRDKNSPFTNAYNNWLKFFLGARTNLNRPVGSISCTRSTSRKHIIEWYEQNYNLCNCTLAIVGNIEFNQVADLCNRYFLDIDKVISLPEQFPEYSLSKKQTTCRYVESDQANVILGGFCCPAKDIEATSAMLVLSQVLGGELSSRFFTLLREKYGYAYQTGFDFSSIRDLGYWYAYAICDRDDSQAVKKLMLEIIEEIRNNGITDEELDSAKNFLKGMHRFDKESLSWQANSLSLLYSLGHDYDYFISKENRINAVTHDIIKDTACKWFRPEDIHIYQEK